MLTLDVNVHSFKSVFFQFREQIQWFKYIPSLPLTRVLRPRSQEVNWNTFPYRSRTGPQVVCRVSSRAPPRWSREKVDPVGKRDFLWIYVTCTSFGCTGDVQTETL